MQSAAVWLQADVSTPLTVPPGGRILRSWSCSPARVSGCPDLPSKVPLPRAQDACLASSSVTSLLPLCGLQDPHSHPISPCTCHLWYFASLCYEAMGLLTAGRLLGVFAPPLLSAAAGTQQVLTGWSQVPAAAGFSQGHTLPSEVGR